MPPIQDQTAPHKESVKTKKIRPHAATSSLKELEAHFGTDLHGGLSPKMAEERLKGREEESLFEASAPKLWPCIKSVIREPVMWLLLAVCVVAMFFNRVGIGFFSLLLLAVHGGVCVYLNYKTLRHYTLDLQAYDVPLVRVLRNRRLLRIRGDRLVPGDVILLRRGDVVPCDARLITSRHLTVAEETLNGNERERERVLLEKDASVTPEALSHRHSPENMVYAGSVVRKGQGRALVVAVAAKTHLGGLVGKVEPSYPLKSPAYAEKLRKTLSLVNMILCVAVIPLTALGILTQGGRYEFLDIFMSALALSVLTLTEHIAAFALYHHASASMSAAEDKDIENSAEIRTPEILEDLCRMDHLILLGTSALHDGEEHPVLICTGGQTYRVHEADADTAVKSFMEKLFLLSMGQADRLKNGAYSRCPSLESVVDRLSEWAEPDTEAVLLRLERMEAKGDTVEVQLRNLPDMSLYLTYDPAELDGCDTCRYGDGEAPMDPDTMDDWQYEIKQADRNGLRVQMLISVSEGRKCLEGLIGYSVGLCRKTKGCIAGMEDGGVCVTSFLREALPEDHLALADAGLTDRAPSLDLAEEQGGVCYTERLASGVRSFVHCCTQDVLDFIDEIHREGGCVGVLSVERVDLPILHAADVAITCASLSMKTALMEDVPHMSGAKGAIPDGEPDGDCASDLCRREAHVVIRRCNARGGGVCGVRRVRLAAGQLTRGLYMSLRFVFLSQILRVLLLTVPLITGTACLSAPALLVSGLVVDALALLCYCQCDLSESGITKREAPPAEKLSAPHRLLKPDMLLTAITTAIPILIASLTRWIGGSDFGDMAYFCALSLLAGQLVIFATGHLPRSRRRGFFSLVFMICIYVGTLSVALASGLNVLYCMLLPLVQPMAWLLGHAIIQRSPLKKKRN